MQTKEFACEWGRGGLCAPDALITPICIITHRCILCAMVACFIIFFPTHGPCCLCSFSLSSCRGNGFRSENSVCVDFFFFYNRDAVGEGEREEKKNHMHTQTHTNSPLFSPPQDRAQNALCISASTQQSTDVFDQNVNVH